MKIEKGQTTITLDIEELSTIENAIDILSDLINASEEEHEETLLGRCGQEIAYEELNDALETLSAIMWAKGEFTIE